MKTYLLLTICLFSLMGCDNIRQSKCPSKFMICDSKGIRCRCGSIEEKKELMDNPKTNQYIHER